MRDVTILIAHPDDEALFAWPVLDRVKRIVCVSSDQSNLSRKWCSERGKCLDDVGKLLGCEVTCFEYDSEFYRLGTRDGSLKNLATRVIEAVGEPDYLFTHNQWGEYGNLDHILCHHIGRTIQARTGIQLLVSDIATEINWLPVTQWNSKHGASLVPRDGSPPAGMPIRNRPGWRVTHEIDRPLFERIKGIYDSRGCWTWAWEPTETCRVYSL